MKRIHVYLGILVMLSACALGEVLQDPGDQVDMTPSTLAGTWHGGTERFITFQEDGSFSAVNLPIPPFQEFVNSHQLGPAPLDGSGTWTLERSSGESTGPRATVHLSFEYLAGIPARFDGPDLDALRPGDGKVYLVVFYVDDQGNSWTGYLKCASDCVLPSPPPTASSPSPRPT